MQIAKPTLTRRQAMVLSGALGLEASCTLPPLGPEPVPLPPAAIDVHCHIFNARDIPIEPFIRAVVLREYPLPEKLAEGAILLAQAIMRLGAPDAAREAAELRSGVPIATAGTGPGLTEPDDDDELLRDRVRQAVAQMQALPLPGAASGPGARPPMPPEVRRFLQDLIRRTGVDRRPGAPLAGSGPAPAVTPDAAAAAVSGIGGEIRGIVLMASLLTLRRSNLAERLRRLPAANANEIVLFTPAMVDYGYWLGAERATTSLAAQVDVMSALSARKDRAYAVHAYVSFCPWRQLMEPDQLATVMDAVRNRGCIGVKLYPVMGFLPYGNAQAADPLAYPDRLRQLGPDWATRLDGALAQLYEFCVAEDVPILAHCSLSQDTSDAAGRRGSPKAWGVVLAPDRWPALRLNLGHFGGIWSLARPRPDGWTGDAVDLMVARPNVYADVSDLSTVVGADAGQIADQRAIMDALGRIFAARDPQRVARGKLMYGTDWVMLSREPGIGTYYPAMKTKFTADLQLTGAETQGFLGLNAARFLGLVPPRGQTGQPGTRRRLEAFYKANGLDNAVLATWDKAASV